MKINIFDATEKLNTLNDKLKDSGLSITLDYKGAIREKDIKVYSFSAGKNNELILCLMKKSGKATNCNNNSSDATLQCVASIELDIYADYDDENKIICEISSYTKKACEGRKYNTFLRSVLIYIANMITFGTNHITTVLSTPINNISIWLLVSLYYTKNKYGYKDIGTGTFQEKTINYKPDDFKDVRASNIFNNAKKASTKKNNNSNVIPRKLNNKNTKKNTKNVSKNVNYVTMLHNNNIMKKKEIVKLITEIEIDISPDTEIGKKNIAISEEKINEFISRQIIF